MGLRPALDLPSPQRHGQSSPAAPSAAGPLLRLPGVLTAPPGGLRRDQPLPQCAWITWRLAGRPVYDRRSVFAPQARALAPCAHTRPLPRFVRSRLVVGTSFAAFRQGTWQAMPCTPQRQAAAIAPRGSALPFPLSTVQIVRLIIQMCGKAAQPKPRPPGRGYTGRPPPLNARRNERNS